MPVYRVPIRITWRAGDTSTDPIYLPSETPETARTSALAFVREWQAMLPQIVMIVADDAECVGP